MKLLIVDDSAMIRRSINTAYKGSLFTQIETAADGLLAVTIFKQLLPDVVTLDITMPHMDGLAAMSQMLEIKPDTAILVISALADHHTAIESLARGAHQFICKPFTAEELREALDDIIKNRVPATVEKQDTEVDAELKKTMAQLTTASTQVTQKVPSPEEYPSGYVQPPAVPEAAKAAFDAVKSQRPLTELHSLSPKPKA
ncbi:response regulator transcription factor [Rubritalea marina]|uniref:response regulator transcription factor n=1 Tax=Rubritalea marina TaxID=361055 RepID=UPI00035C76AA|nr:response regulator [Rubritalea marina]